MKQTRMIKTKGKKNFLRTVKVEKDTWVLELPEEICAGEGFAKGTLASLTIKDGAIRGSFISPTAAAKRSAERFIGKYQDFMKEIEEIDS
jgi:hypothetical protein